MKQFDKYLNAILVLLVVVAAGVIFVHVIHSYERVTAQRPEVAVTIPEGFTMYDIDRVLSQSGVLAPGVFVAAVQAKSTASSSLEGMLFPDTYDFYISSTAPSVVQKFLDNFNVKAAPLFASDPQDATDIPTGMQNRERDLIIASMVQKEVASSTDMAIVAGILEKRLASSTFLNVDATICYAKQMAAYAADPSTTSTTGCYPITAADLKADSHYNTYLYKGLPPTPIGNPGLEAIQATLHPQSSTYWYYLSDPKTGKTIYAVTLAQQEADQRKYLR